MQTISRPFYAGKIEAKEGVSLITRFFRWAENQEHNRLHWLAVALGGHGCVLTPVTLFAIVLAGNAFIFWPIAIVAMVMCLVVNLAAMPTKITVPVFFLSVLIDVVIIICTLVIGWDLERLFL